MKKSVPNNRLQPWTPLFIADDTFFFLREPSELTCGGVDRRLPVGGDCDVVHMYAPRHTGLGSTAESQGSCGSEVLCVRRREEKKNCDRCGGAFQCLMLRRVL